MVFSEKTIKRNNCWGTWDDGNKEKIDGESDLNKKKDGESERYERIYGYGVVESVLEKGVVESCMQQETTLCPHGTTSPLNYIYIYI